MKLRKTIFRILRFNPERDKEPYYDAFRVRLDKRMTVLDVLENIKHDQDASLTFRRSCRSGICGSCAMKINGSTKLACKTRAILEASKHGEVLIEPMENMPLIKDLIADMKEFWGEIERGKPWLVTGEHTLKSLRENLVNREQIQVSDKLAECIMCGACFSDCISRVFDKNFAGPASLAKIYRFVADPREKDRLERIDGLAGLGLWSCTHCYFCWSQCPRDVRPIAAISALREHSVKTGESSRGARHVTAFSSSIKNNGMLNEAAVYLKTMRLNVLQDLGLIIKMAMKGKVPSPIGRPSPKIDEVRLLHHILGE